MPAEGIGMKKSHSKKSKSTSDVSRTTSSHILLRYQPELDAIDKSWEVFLALKSQTETAFQQMMEFYDELDKEIRQLESREDAILQQISEKEAKQPDAGARKTLLGLPHRRGTADRTGDYVAYWRKRISEKRKEGKPRLLDTLRILELKRKKPSLTAAAIFDRLYPKSKKTKDRSINERVHVIREIQKILADWRNKQT